MSSVAVNARSRPRTLAHQLVDSLGQRIRDGRLVPGEKLPTEAAFMMEFHVSRTVVREAISRLQAAGLVETRHGIGTFVLPPLPVTASQLDVVTIRDVLAMLELRISLETESAALAAQRRTDEHLALMRRAIVAFDESIVNGRSAIDEDFQFHLQIALATQNKYFEDFYRQLGTSTIPRTKLNTAQLSTEFAPNYLNRTNREQQSSADA